ncbi:BTAD domain-containing putative transcriptional regulator [Phytomonospora endophytica]|uniref:Putative ATPase n=1 Tax=Phytomonospora endophytica TaxID=714109 RepID=A0A841FJ32_9ACTN|nr:BTAD domain-containing putative transcriptional regulator [Phytomonospora endophytica]MBB6034953.1 putative ATPase [Phytomonospora endophytica]GIG70655.1 SARP family transcriptional regulator [Phytomonospora endophytica]
MRVGLLGPLEVTDGGRALVIGGRRVRALLIRLAVDAGRFVPPGELARAIWTDDGPADPAHALQALVSRLRAALPGDVALELGDAGYRLGLAPEDVDLHRFEALIADPAPARLREALALWRGGLPAETDDAPYAVALGARLGELRLTAVESAASAELRLPDADARALTAELGELTAAHPLRERLGALLITALHADRRRAEALAVFERYRARLAEELGADPGPELRAAHLAALRADPAPRGNLRAALTGFVGRGEELARVAALTRERRLVTLVGPGGVGKTRLAVTAAARAPETAWLVELAAAGPGDDLAAVALHALGRHGSTPGADALANLTETLSAEPALLVLDNCEHLLDDAARLAEDLLARCPSLRILATSREPLGVLAESLLPVPPMDPATSLRLFTERAMAVQPDFDLDAERDLVIGLCRTLDGLPLAIELAAARLRVMTPGILRDRLADRFAILRGGNRTALPRHRTLLAVVEWSFDLLDDTARAAAENLAVFPGSFAADAAAALGVRTEDLDSLVDKSLLELLDGGRYRMLETIAEYGRSRLREDGRLRMVGAAHAAHFAALAARAAPALRSSEQLAWLAELAVAEDDLLAAFQHTLAADPGAALVLATDLSPFWTVRDGSAATAERLLRAVEPASSHERAPAAVADHLLHTILAGRPSKLSVTVERPGEAVGALVTALSAYLDDDPATGIAALRPWQDHPDPFTRGTIRFASGLLLSNTGGLDAVRAALAAAADAFAACGERRSLVTALGFLAQVRTAAGDFVGAAEALERSMVPAAELGAGHDRRVWLGVTHVHAGDREAARVEFEAYLARTPGGANAGTARAGLASLARLDGDLAEAARQLALAASVETGEPGLPALLRLEAGHLAGDRDGAARHLREALDLAAAMPDMLLVAAVGVGVARHRLRHGDPGTAADVLGAAHGLRGAADDAHPDVAGLREDLDRALGEAVRLDRLERGRGLPREAALRLIREAVAG